MEDITKILKNVPKGTKLYSPIFGECFLNHIVHNGEIWVKYKSTLQVFDRYGRHYNEGECLLFPSKEAHNWTAFKSKTEFKPFDKVLVRDDNTMLWRVNIFSHYVSTNFNPYVCIAGCYRQCIPYEGNEHLVGTNKNP